MVSRERITGKKRKRFNGSFRMDRFDDVFLLFLLQSFQSTQCSNEQRFIDITDSIEQLENGSFSLFIFRFVDEIGEIHHYAFVTGSTTKTTSTTNPIIESKQRTDRSKWIQTEKCWFKTRKWSSKQVNSRGIGIFLSHPFDVRRRKMKERLQWSISV